MYIRKNIPCKTLKLEKYAKFYSNRTVSCTVHEYVGDEFTILIINIINKKVNARHEMGKIINQKRKNLPVRMGIVL